jgi:hypothetical protein
MSIVRDLLEFSFSQVAQILADRADRVSFICAILFISSTRYPPTLKLQPSFASTVAIAYAVAIASADKSADKLANGHLLYCRQSFSMPVHHHFYYISL